MLTLALGTNHHCLRRQVLFVKVDVDSLPEVAQRYGVRSMPTFVFLKGDEEIERFSGADAKRLRAVIDKRRP